MTGGTEFELLQGNKKGCICTNQICDKSLYNFRGMKRPMSVEGRRELNTNSEPFRIQVSVSLQLGT